MKIDADENENKKKKKKEAPKHNTPNEQEYINKTDEHECYEVYLSGDETGEGNKLKCKHHLLGRMIIC